MADVTPVSGSDRMMPVNNGMIEIAQIETAAAGEDGVTYTFKMSKIIAAFVSGNEDGKEGPYSIVISGSKVTVKSLDDIDTVARGDAATVGIMAVGY